jgi:hypothetical protein
MRKNITTRSLPHSEIEESQRLFDNWFDPIETVVRDRVRGFIETMLEVELDEALSRSRYVRRKESSEGDPVDGTAVTGHRHGHRSRKLLGSFGLVEIESNVGPTANNVSRS